MDLYERMFTASEPADRISPHTIRAVLHEYGDGQATRVQIINFLALDSEAEADLNTACDLIDGMNASQKVVFLLKFEDTSFLAAKGIKYNTKSAFWTRISN